MTQIRHEPSYEFRIQCGSLEEFEDPKGAIRVIKSKKVRHNNVLEKGQKNKQRSTKHTHKAKYRIPRTPLTLGVSEGWVVPAPLVTPVVFI